jgi:hypothetical protein
MKTSLASSVLVQNKRNLFSVLGTPISLSVTKKLSLANSDHVKQISRNREEIFVDKFLITPSVFVL